MLRFWDRLRGKCKPLVWRVLKASGWREIGRGNIGAATDQLKHLQSGTCVGCTALRISVVTRTFIWLHVLLKASYYALMSYLYGIILDLMSLNREERARSRACQTGGFVKRVSRARAAHKPLHGITSNLR